MIFLSEAFSWVPKWTHHQLLVTGVSTNDPNTFRIYIFFGAYISVFRLRLLHGIAHTHHNPEMQPDAVRTGSGGAEPQPAGTPGVPAEHPRSRDQSNGQSNDAQLHAHSKISEISDGGAVYVETRTY